MDAEELVAGRYRLLEELGSGGVGTVRRARDTLLNRDVAIKEIRFPSQVTEVERIHLTERAIAEAAAAARLNHPKIITVYDVVEHEARPWIVMQLVVGQSLERLIAVEGRLAPDAVALLGMELLDALEAAHAAGIVHRDVKPSNVLLPASGGLLLTDFSIAKVLGSDSNTLHGVLTGSPGYMAPERFVDGVTGPEADLFGLGATLYHAVEGNPPFDFENLMAGMFATATKPHPVPAHAGELVPVLDGLLAKEAARRLTIGQARELLAPLARNGGLTDAASAGPSGAVSGLAARGAIVPIWEIDAPQPRNPVAGPHAIPLWGPLTPACLPDPSLDDPQFTVADPAERDDPGRGPILSRRLRIAVVLAGSVMLALAVVVTAQAMSGEPPDQGIDDPRPTRPGIVPVAATPTGSGTPQPTGTAPAATASAGSSPAASPGVGPSESTASSSAGAPAAPATARLTAFSLARGTHANWIGTLTFDQPTPEGGVTVTLSYALPEGSDSAGAPSNVSVPAGALSFDFSFQVTILGEPGAATATAVLDGIPFPATFG